MTFNNSELNKEESSPQESEETKDSLNNEQKPMTSASTKDIPSFGWSEYAERVNGRFAMVGFLAILIIEILSNTNFLKWAGFIS